MKRNVRLLLAAVLCMAALFAVCRQDVRAARQYVFDYADLLTDEEEAKLQAECERLRELTKADYVIVTNTLSGEDAGDYIGYIDNFYDDQGFGYDAPLGDGSAFLIEMTNRITYTSTAGRLVQSVSEDSLTSLNEEAASRMSEGAGSACEYYLKRMSKLVKYESTGGRSMAEIILPSLSVGFALALILTVIAVCMMKGSDSKADLKAVHQKGNGKLITSRDVFVRQTETRRKIEKDDSSNHSSGGHSSRSSGSSSHGGGSAGHF